MKRHTVLIFVLLVAPITGAGCGYSGVVAPLTEEHKTDDGGPAVESGAVEAGDGETSPTFVMSDAGVVQPTVGSPLCNASAATGCYPDSPTPARACPLDGGTEMPDASLACRIVADSDGVNPEPVCATPGQASEGQPCQSSSDCAAALDCVVVGASSSPQCARYCCLGNSACSAVQFCDVEPLLSPMFTKVPVCVQMAHCELLSPTPAGTCTGDTTCSVVREDGQTSCVEVGNAAAGEPCDSLHCGVGLACLGTSGSRRCFKLCHTTASDECGAESCLGGAPLFSDGFGICQ